MASCRHLTTMIQKIAMPIKQDLAQMRRPKTLLHAAQICAGKRHHDPILKHLLGARSYRSGSAVLSYLLSEERRVNILRKQKSQSYRVRRHILLLSALLHEMRK